MTIEELKEEVMNTFAQILRENPYDGNLNQTQVEERMTHKKLLRKALKSCAYGDRNAKLYVKDYIKDCLLRKGLVCQENIDEIIPFEAMYELSAQDKFYILLYQYEEEYGSEAMEQFIIENGLDMPKQDTNGMSCYEITEDDIEKVYEESRNAALSFNDKLNILTQRVYELYKGNGVIDQIRDMKIDGISVGVSGIPESNNWGGNFVRNDFPVAHDSVWIFFQGKSIYLSFLKFGSEKELIRVCRNSYRYNNPGQLSQVRGYLVTEAKDGARVAVARPPFSESWVMFIRKFDTVKKEEIENLITDNNKELPIELIKWLIKGCQITGITGEQGVGKTTLLMSVIGFINPAYNLRIQEIAFELQLRKLYPKRNIVTFKETDSVSGEEGLNFMKKSDGSVTILGEVANNEVASWLISTSQVASLFTLFTHHAKTARDLIISMRNALLLKGGFQNERVALEQVVEAIHFDVHMKKDLSGHRYIERITEIVPDKGAVFRKIYGGEEREAFSIRDLVVFENGAYHWKETMSQQGKDRISASLTLEEKAAFQRFMEQRSMAV